MEQTSTKRIILLLTTVVVVAIASFVLINREGREETFNKNIPTNSGLSVLAGLDPEKDTDGDGLKDWQEALWQTNRYEKDTDGDGTTDGDEVEQGRDPLNSSPQDALSLKEYNPTGSFTEQVSQNLYGQYSILKQENVEISTDTQKALIQGSLLNNNLSLGVNIYTYDDINIDPEYTNYREYADNMGVLMTRNSPKKGEDGVLKIIERSLSEARPEILDELEIKESRYNKFTQEALEVKVPFALAENHLLFVNSLETTRASLAGLQESDTDPLKGVLSLNMYNESISSGAIAISTIAKFYETNGITFEQNEAGYIFLYGL